MTLTFTVDRQSITRTDTQQAVANSVSYLRAQFAFLNDWDTDHILTPLFQNGTRVYTPELLDTGRYLDEDNACIVPQEVLAETGTLYVSIFDETDGVRITTDRAAVPIERSGYTQEAEETLTPAPSAYEQILADYADYKQTGLKATNTDLTLEDGKLHLTAGGEAVGTGAILPKTVMVNMLDVQACLKSGDIVVITPEIIQNYAGIGFKAGTIGDGNVLVPSELYALLPEWSGTNAMLSPCAARVGVSFSVQYGEDKMSIEAPFFDASSDQNTTSYAGIYKDTQKSSAGEKTLYFFCGIYSTSSEVLKTFAEEMSEMLSYFDEACISFIPYSGGGTNG